MRVQIKLTQKLEVPIHRHEVDTDGKYVKTSEVIRVDTFEREAILFSGSEEAFKIWKTNHSLPLDATVKRWPKKN